jgi:polyisoprenoid-binding protein YceI
MTRRCIVALGLALALFGVPLVAIGDPIAVDKSEIAFTVKAMGVKFDGRFRKWKADVVFRPQSLAESKAVLDVDLASIDLASEDSESAARGPQWFDTAKFPVAHFVSTAVKDLGGNRYEFDGKLTIKGVTRDCVVPVSVKADASGNRVAEGQFAIHRLDYRIGEGEWADQDTVANDVAVRVRIVFSPAG